MLNSLGAYYPEMSSNNREQDLAHFDETAALLISKVRTIAAMTYRQKQGLPFVFPDHQSTLCRELPAHDVLRAV